MESENQLTYLNGSVSKDSVRCYLLILSVMYLLSLSFINLALVFNIVVSSSVIGCRLSNPPILPLFASSLNRHI